MPNYVAAQAEHLPGTTIGVDWEYVSSGVDDDVIATVREALERFMDLGVDVREVTVPAEYRQLVNEWGLTCGRETAAAHADYYPAKKDLYGPVLANLIEVGLSVDDAKYDELEAVRRVFREKLAHESAGDRITRRVFVFVIANRNRVFRHGRPPFQYCPTLASLSGS